MNVLFDDGRYIDRRLLYIEAEPNPVNSNTGKYDPHSEAFQFYKPIDNVWGDFKTRDLEENNHAKIYSDAKKQEAAIQGTQCTVFQEQQFNNKGKIEFKDRYFLKQIQFVYAVPQEKDWGKEYVPNLKWNEITASELPIDITELFPETILKRANVMGIAFSIYKYEAFNKTLNNKKEILHNVTNRSKTIEFYLALRIVVKGEGEYKADDKNNFLNSDDIKTLGDLSHNKTEVVTENALLNEWWDTGFDLTPPQDDNMALYREAPTLVLNKQTILNSRNYTGDWTGEDWNKEFLKLNKDNTIDGEKINSEIITPTKDRMVIRIGREDERYILFLHGDKEANCPIRIPQD